MHVPAGEQMASLDEIHRFINDYSFGLLISQGDQPGATHMPFMLRPDEGPNGVLYGHIARANDQAKILSDTQSMAIFSGPHAFISPRWYQTKPAVPTWNYSAVHVWGPISILSQEQTLTLVRQTSEHYDPALNQYPDIMTDAYVDKLLGAIIGFRMEITHYQSRIKLGQHKPAGDRAGVKQGLEQSQPRDAASLLDFMRQFGLE